ncbi:MAG: UvrB/UvrC motif-containing protein [Candidatus Gygaella obscura]|nr:UvrB/UvrC motif-containing protein [Candidatus Gygaella obscura]
MGLGMLCDICHKIEATVHLTEIVDGQITELHLCEHCAKQKSMQMEQQFGLSDLLAGLVDFGKAAEEKEDLKQKCPNCKLTYREFKKVGRLGCSQCYTTFRRYLEPLLKSIHGASHHLGKVPAHNQLKTKANTASRTENNNLDDLKSRLQIVIAKEEFEQAAAIRDKIKDLEKKLKDKEKK